MKLSSLTPVYQYIAMFGMFMVNQLPDYDCNLINFENVIKINKKLKYKPQNYKIMKTKIIALFVVAFLLVGTAVKADSYKKEVINKVKKEMVYPDIAIQDNIQGDVWVAFRVDDNGKFQVFQANSTDEDLKALVVEKLEKINPPAAGIAPNELYYMKFSFKLR